MNRITLVALGFVSLEGPVIDDEGNLFVADLRAGTVVRLGADGSRDVVVADRFNVGGLCLHAAGGLVMSGPSVAHITNSATRTLLERGDIVDRRGASVAGFNDLAADVRGRVLVGVLRANDDGEPVPGELVRISAERDVEVLYDDIHPNGLAFSPGDERLYAADTFRRRLVVFEAAGDTVHHCGEISTTDVPGLPDGIACDVNGDVWVAFYQGGCIARFRPDGRLAETITMPAPKPLSVCFAGSSVLVVTGRSQPGATDTGAIYRVAVAAPGAAVHRATV